MFHRLQLRPELVDDGGECLVEEQDTILGVVEDVDELLLEQPRIDGVDDAPHADRAVPGDHVPAMVHRQRRHPVALADAKPLQRVGQPA